MPFRVLGHSERRRKVKIGKYAVNWWIVAGTAIVNRKMPLITKRGAWCSDPVVQCASCRMIRIGKTWYSYHPAAKKYMMSHTICPRCTYALYPEQYAKMKTAGKIC